MGETWAKPRPSGETVSRPALRITPAQPDPADSSLPAVEEAVIDGGGHLLQIQRPEPVARAVAQFPARHRAAPSLSVAGGMLDV